MKKKKSGFTLIELLVVIAIIGILSSIVLVSLGGAKNKAKDARIQADLSQVRSIAEMVYTDVIPTSYASLCDTANTLNAGETHYGTQLGTIEDDIGDQASSNTCYATTTSYCVSARLLGGGFYCVDSNGRAISTTTNPCSSVTSVCH